MAYGIWGIVCKMEAPIALAQQSSIQCEQTLRDRQVVLQLGGLAAASLAEAGIPAERSLQVPYTGWVLPGCVDRTRGSYNVQHNTVVSRHVGLALVDGTIAWVASPAWAVSGSASVRDHVRAGVPARGRLFDTVVPFTDQPEVDYAQLAQTAGAAALGFLQWRFCYRESEFSIASYSQAHYRGAVGVEAQIAAILADTIKRPRASQF